MSSLDFAGGEIVIDDLREPTVPGHLGSLTLGPDQGYVVTQIDPGFPTVRQVSVSVPDASGTIDDTEWWGARAVGVTVGLWPERAGVTNRVLMDRLLAFCQPHLRPQVRWRLHPDDGWRRWVVRVASVSPVVPLDGPDFASVSIAWVVPTGLTEAADETVFYAVGAPLGDVDGRTYDLTFPRSYPPFVGPLPGTGAVDNVGPLPVHWTAAIEGPIRNPVLRCETIGRELRFTARGGVTLAAGQVLSIDSRRKRVTVGGVNAYGTLDFPESRWFLAPPGLHTWRLVGDDVEAGAQAEIRFRAAWL